MDNPVKFFIIKNKDNKYLRLESRFLDWNDPPNVSFYFSKNDAQQVLDHFFQRTQKDPSDPDYNDYNPLEYDLPLTICEYELVGKEINQFPYLP